MNVNKLVIRFFLVVSTHGQSTSPVLPCTLPRVLPALNFPLLDTSNQHFLPMVADISDPTAPNPCLSPLVPVVQRGQSWSPVVGVLFLVAALGPWAAFRSLRTHNHGQKTCLLPFLH